MPKISYPFAAIPNQICRGGHGAINLSVLTVLLSHGLTTASMSTLASEIGCNKKSILPAIRYWMEVGPENGIDIKVRERVGMPTVYEIIVHEMINTSPKLGSGTRPENGSGVKSNLTRKRVGGDPKTGDLPDPKTGHKEEPIKKNQEEDNTPALQAGDDQLKADRPITDLFYKTINQSINWGNRTTIEAEKFLIMKHGSENAITIARYAISIQGQPYAPIITTPYQLKEKLSQLIIFKQRASVGQKTVATV